MNKRLPSNKIRKEAVRNWPFQPLSFDRSFALSQLEKNALAAWNAHGRVGRGDNAFKKETVQHLNRLIQPIEAVLLYRGSQKGGEYRLLSCVSLLLHEMHRRQTSLWAWDDLAWVEIIGKTQEEFKRVHHAFLSASQKSPNLDRQYIMTCAYLLCEVPIYQLVTGYHPLVAAQRMFGGGAVEKAIQALTAESKRFGRGSSTVSVATCSALLANRSPELTKLTLPILTELYENPSNSVPLKREYIKLSILLHNIKVLPNCLPTPWKSGRGVTIGIDDAISTDWARLIQAWYENSTEIDAVRDSVKASVAKAARWAAEKYPAAGQAHQWTRGTAVAYVAAVARMKVGQWQHPKFKSSPNLGKPMKASHQASLLSHLRTFFRDCHEWEWFPMSFNPDRCLATPKSISAKREPNPKPVDYEQWAKLCEAGLSLTEKDFPVTNSSQVRWGVTPQICYPLDMMRAMAVVWLYTGLRSDEICRLQVGCIQPIHPKENENSSLTLAICNLTVPVGKNGSGFTKPILGFVGDTIKIWERMRPSVPKHWDYKTAEAVDFLFVWRGKRVGSQYLNRTIIPVLCRKAGIPIEDALGRITSHRARHTLATQLSDAAIPMSNSDLQDWFGHISGYSLRFYARENARKLREAYATANHISIDKRQLEQLKEPTASGSTLAAADELGPSVNLGHGFCTYAFFAHCSRRKPCDNCSFYKPKVSFYSQLREAKSHLLHMLRSLPLSKEARQAVEDAITLNETLEAIMRSSEGNPGTAFS